MSLSTAFFIGVFAGVAAGAGAGRLRQMRHPDESPVVPTWYGAVTAAFVFGAAVAFDKVGQFLLWNFRPTSARAMPEFTVFCRAGLGAGIQLGLKSHG